MSSKFTLNDSFLDTYRGQQPAWGPLGEITYRRTYSRKKCDDTYEEFWETCQRVVEGVYNIQKDHCDRYTLPWNGKKAQNSAQEMYQRMFEFKWLPPGRGMWMMGTDFVKQKGSAALNNCGFSSSENISVSFSEPFIWAMDMSMHGVGVGFDTRGAGKVTIRDPRVTEEPFVVSDSREGWCELARTVLDAYVGKGALPINVDYSHVRPEGEPLKGFGGVASGPEPLKELYRNFNSVLGALAGEKITSEAIADLFNIIGVCVVSGGIRRSALIAIGDPEDETFLNLKNPELNAEKMAAWRWSSNNSIFARVGMDYTAPAELTKKNGEIGYVYLDNMQRFGRMSDPENNEDRRVRGVNPCGEQPLEHAELCTLVETFPANHETLEDYQRTLKAAYLYAKTITLLPTHSPTTNAVMLRNRRIGTSQSGIAQAIAKRGFREHMRWCDSGYKYLKELDYIYSSWLCVPKSKKISSVKPSGSVSLLAGATPGIHYPESEFYWRTMRFSSTSPQLKQFKEAGYRIEPGEGGNTSIVYFPIAEANFSRSKRDVSMWEQLELAAAMQAYWSDNSVSSTITFKPEEAADIPRALQMYETRLKSVSFLPHLSYEDMVAAGYKHPPYQPMGKEEYDAELARLHKVWLVGSHEVDDKYCDGDKCML